MIIPPLLFCLIQLLFRLTFLLLGSVHTIDAQCDERDTQNLSHVNRQTCLEGFLYFLGLFNEESGNENISETETEIKSGTYLLRIFTIKYPTNYEK